MARANRSSGLFITVTFKVSVETEWGDVVTVTGNAPTLGKFAGPRYAQFWIWWTKPATED